MLLHERANEQEIRAHAIYGRMQVKRLLAQIGATNSDTLKGQLNQVAQACGLAAFPEKTSTTGRIGRLLDLHHWRRGLRRSCLRANEQTEHAAGHIRRTQQCYVSDHATHTKAVRNKANRATLAGLEVVSDEGECLNLLEVSDRSISNPAIRRGELMTRCRGFEEMAEFIGWKAVFLTITCPSRFHRFKGGKANPKWTNESPKDAQAYLNKIWQKIRAAYGRKGILPFGFRVCEPHHDACPHWHLLLFVDPGHIGWFDASAHLQGAAGAGSGLLGIVGKYALADSGHEAGAERARFTVKHIDPAQGSAAGYIAKYIAKNIDGLKETGDGVGLDYASGKAAQDAARRVRDWASTWGIRQFQPIGGPAVTVWRELRRLGETPCQLELFEKLRAASDRADWMAYCMLQGGPEVKRRDHAAKPLRLDGLENRYGETSQAVRGVEALTGEFLITRTKEWTVQPAGANEQELRDVDWKYHLAFEREHADFLRVYRDLVFQRSAASTWTSVNNCTPQTLPVFDFSQFPSSENDPPPIFTRRVAANLATQTPEIDPWTPPPSPPH